MQLSGYHATTVSNYEQIVSQGFLKGKGLRGTGVYFWEENCGFGVELSKGWYRFCKERRDYDSCRNSEIAIIQGFFEPKDEYSFLNIEVRKIRESIYRLAVKHKMDVKDLAGLYAIYDLFFCQLENHTRCSLQVIETTVNTFGVRYSEFPSQLLGQPYCYIVRDTGIINVKLHEGGNNG